MESCFLALVLKWGEILSWRPRGATMVGAVDKKGESPCQTQGQSRHGASGEKYPTSPSSHPVCLLATRIGQAEPERSQKAIEPEQCSEQAEKSRE